MKYFAYGSNLNQNDLVDWCNRKNQPVPNLLNPQPFRLESYRLGFTRYSETRGGGVADVIFSPGEFCWGVVFDVTQHDIDILNVKEGTKSQAYVQIPLPNGMITYEVVKKENFVKPSSEYVDLIVEGAKHYRLPQTWIDYLKSFKQKK